VQGGEESSKVATRVHLISPVFYGIVQKWRPGGSRLKCLICQYGESEKALSEGVQVDAHRYKAA